MSQGNIAHILIVDDDPAGCKTLSDILAIKGYRVSSAQSGKSALDFLEQTPVDLAIVDLKLPDMDGNQVLEAIKRDHPTTECIMLTGFASQESAIQAINLGAFSYLQKPYEVDYLLLTIQRALEKQRAFLDLQLAAEEWQRTFDAMSEYVTIQDSSFRIQRINQAAATAFGSTIDKMLGKPCYEVFHAQECPIEGCVYHRVNESGKLETIQYYEPSIGEWLEISATPLRDQSGAVTGIVHVMRDITPRIQSEHEIRARSQDLALINSLNTIVNRGGDIGEVMQTLDSGLQENIGGIGSMVLLLTQDDNYLESPREIDAEHTRSLEETIGLPLPIRKVRIDLSTSEYFQNLLNSKETISLKTPKEVNRLLQAFVKSTLPENDHQKVSPKLHKVQDALRLQWGMVHPLKEEEKAFGMLILFSPEPVSDENMSRLVPIAQHIESVFGHLRAQEATRKHIRELSLLFQISQASVTAQSEEELLESVTQLIGGAFYPDHFGVLLVDKKTQSLRVPPSYVGLPEESRKITIALGEGITGRVAASGESVRVDDIEKNARFIPSTPGIRSELCVPINSGTETLGVINAESKEHAFFDSADERLLSTIASLIGIALQNVWLLESERRRAERLAAILELNLALSEYGNEESLFKGIVEDIAEIAQSPTCTVFLINQEKGQAEMAAHYGLLKGTPENISFPVDLPPIKNLLETASPLIIADIDQEAPEMRNFLVHPDVQSFYAYPLIREKQVLGFFTLSSLSPHQPSQSEMLTYRLLANRIAIALENIRLFQDERRKTRQLTLLNRIAQSFASSLEVPELCLRAYQEIKQVLDCPDFGVFRFYPNQEHLIPFFLIEDGEPVDTQGSPKIADQPESELQNQALKNKRPINIGNLQELRSQSHGSLPASEPEKAQSLLVVPLIKSDEPIGLLQIQSHEKDQYTHEDEELISAVGNQLALAISNAELYQKTRQQVSELAAISRVSTALRAADNVVQLLPIFLDELLGVMHSEAGSIRLYDAARKELVSVVSRGWFAKLSNFQIRPGQGIAGQVFLKGEPYISKELRTDPSALPQSVELVPPGWGGACLPILTSQETIGVVFIAVRNPRQLTEEDVHLLTSLVEIAGNAIQRSRLHEQTERRLQHITALRTIDQAIISSMDLNLTLDILLTQITSLLAVDAADILLLNHATLKLEHAFDRGFRTRTIELSGIPLGQGIAGKVAIHREPVFVEDITQEKDFIRIQELMGEGFHAYYCHPLATKGKITGVLELFHRSTLQVDDEWRELVNTLALQAAIAIDNARLFEEIQQTSQQLAIAYDSTLEGWARALELRDAETGGHSKRVMELTLQIASAFGINDEDLNHIRRGVLLHDIGKMGIPDSILQKPGPLDDEEWELMRKHPQYAFDLLNPIPFLRPALDIPYCHHEKWDGSGYPRGLVREQIPLSARIFAVVDVYDALTSDRPYRKAWSKSKALEYIREQAEAHFDPKVVEIFLQVVGES